MKFEKNRWYKIRVRIQPERIAACEAITVDPRMKVTACEMLWLTRFTADTLTSNDTAVTHIFSLVVTDDDGTASTADSVIKANFAHHCQSNVSSSMLLNFEPPTSF